MINIYNEQKVIIKDNIFTNIVNKNIHKLSIPNRTLKDQTKS